MNPFVDNIVMICAISGVKVNYPHSKFLKKINNRWYTVYHILIDKSLKNLIVKLSLITYQAVL